MHQPVNSIHRANRRRRRITAAWAAAWAVERLESRTLLSVGPIPTVPTPAAHWTFDEATGGTAADSSGNGFNASLGSGVTHVTGNVGTHAIALNGSASAVATVTGPVVDTSGSFTASAWVDLASVSGYQTVLSIAGTNVAGFFLQLRSDTGTFAFTRLASDSTSAVTTYVASPTLPVAGTWYHLVGVDDATAGTLTLYVDGQSMGTTPYTGGWAATGNTLIGHGFYSGGEVDYVDGSIDDAEMFSSALSAAQVVALDQPAAYSFDEGTGTTDADVSGHGNTLTLNSGASWAAGRIGSNSLAVNGTTTGNATDATPVVNTALPFSVSAWVNLSSISGYQTFVSIDGMNTSGFYLQLRGDTGKFAFSRLTSDSDSATTDYAGATAAPVAGTWYNLIGINNVAAHQLQLYVNGVLQATTTYNNGWQANGATVIGGGKFNGARTDLVSGDIDDVHFYDSPLNAADAAFIGSAGSSTITVATGTTGVTVSPDLFGAFMEDINYGGEGGIYHDEVRNSGFNDSTNPLNAWAAFNGSGVVSSLTSDTTTGPTSALNQSGALTVTSGVSSTARVGISNSGYFGVAVAPSTSYEVDFYAKATAGFTGPLTVDLESTTGTVYAVATVPSITTAWADYTVTLNTGTNTPTTATNLFVISTNSTSANGQTIWFGATYLYPPSYDGAGNHLRIDLMQDLAALKPAIFRVPGGNYLEGNTDATHFEWSNTIGPVADRPGHYNSAWGYWSTDGMGLDEYLQMAEEVGAQPILAVFAGYTLNGSSDTGAALTNDVTDAVNEIHYVLDPVTTSWGAERAANGHPAPYNVSQVEVGNEDFFSSTYSTRYPLFYNAIHAAFPQLKIIATGTNTGGSPYDVIDDHFYETPQWFEANSGYFNNTARGSSQIFIGEYASNNGSPTPNMESALGDSSWLLGLERNSDLVTESSYAPLWVNVSSYEWPTNLIGFNNTTSYGSPSYYAQVMLSQNHGTTVVSDTVSGAGGLQTLVTRTGATYYFTVINTLGTANPASLNIAGVTNVSATATATVLSAATTTAANSITSPTAVVPVTSAVSGLGTNFSYTFPGYSITILQFTADNVPMVATPAAASPSPSTGTTTSLSVLGADSVGESSLIYTWAATGPAPVTYSDNGTNTAKNTTTAFTAAGNYTFQVTILNPTTGLSTVSNVNETVVQALNGIAVTQVVSSIFDGQTTQYSAVAYDQFDSAMSNQPGITWSLGTGSAGSISPTGLYTAPGSGPAADTVTATGGGVSGSVTATVILSVIDGTPGNDTIQLVRSGSNLLVFVDNATTPVYSVPFGPLAGLTINTGIGTDSVNIDFSGGATPVPAGGITVNGGGGVDSLIVTGTAGNDTATVNGSSVTFNGSPITYNGITSIVINGNGGADALTQAAQPGNAATVAFNSSATTGPSSSDSLNVSAGNFSFPAPAAGSGIQPIRLASLSIAATSVVSLGTAGAFSDRYVLVLGTLTDPGKLDLGGNDLITGGSINTINTALTAGYNLPAGGTWNGPGIDSSAAHANTAHLTTLGILQPASSTTFDSQPVSPNNVIVKYTYFGDINLSGNVDGSDYSLIDYGYKNHLTGWANGDLNYDRVIDGSDYALIDNAFNNQGASITPTAAVAVLAASPAAVGAPVAAEPKKVDKQVPARAVLPAQYFSSSVSIADEMEKRKKPRAALSAAIGVAGDDSLSSG
jgi:alpha-L-arabinofuranosidase